MSTRQTSICMMIGAVFLFFAVFLLVRPKELTYVVEYGGIEIKREVTGPMMDASVMLGSRSYGLYSYQKGSHLVGDDRVLLSSMARSALCVERRVENGRMVYRRSPNGASNTFTMIDLGGWRAGIPVGLHVLAAVMGILLMVLPLVAAVARRHSMRWIAQQVGSSNGG